MSIRPRIRGLLRLVKCDKFRFFFGLCRGCKNVHFGFPCFMLLLNLPETQISLDFVFGTLCAIKQSQIY